MSPPDGLFLLALLLPALSFLLLRSLGTRCWLAQYEFQPAGTAATFVTDGEDLHPRSVRLEIISPCASNWRICRAGERRWGSALHRRKG